MWDKIAFGFDVEEETVNFGTRKMAVCSSNTAIYETNTAAIITNAEVSSCSHLDHLNIKSSKCTDESGALVVSINQCIITFNGDCTEMKSHYSYDVDVDCFAVTSSGSIVFVALNNGDLYCSWLHSNGNHVFIRNFAESSNDTKTFCGLFLHQNENRYEVVLLTYSGKIYVLKNINLCELEKACVTEESDDDITRVGLNMSLETYSVGSQTVVMGVEFIKSTEPFIFMLVQSEYEQELQLWNNKYEIVDSLCLTSHYMKKVQITKIKNFIIGLTTKNAVLIICLYTLTPLFYYNSLSVIDFEIMDDNDDVSLLLLIQQDSVCQLQLISIPGFTPKFTMDVCADSYLIGGQSSLQDLFYLDVNKKSKIEMDAENESSDSVTIKVISENHPEFRLERMLKRGKFEEAEKFAKTFNLDMELVYKSQLQKLLMDIQPWSKSEEECLETNKRKFKELLHKLKDVEFLGSCCLNVISSDFSLIKDVLQYAESRIKVILSENESEDNIKLRNLFNRISSTLLRLSTFLVVTETPVTADKWLAFCSANLIMECQFRVQQGSLDQVILIWSRHMYQLKSQLSYEQAVSLWRCVPLWVSCSKLLQWLQLFLPVCLRLFPKMLSSLIGWSKEKINSMELKSDKEWPESGLIFLKKLLSIVRQNVTSSKVSSKNIVQSEYANDSFIKEILHYIKILTELLLLKKDYGVIISIAEYTQDNSEDAIFSILDKVPIEKLKSFVTGFMEKFRVQKNLLADSIVSSYIQYLVEGSVCWWHLEEAPWESYVAVLLDCIIGIDERLQCVLSVLKQTPVPWSSTMLNIYENSIRFSKNPLTKTIKEQKKTVNCKIILKKYNLKQDTFTKAYMNEVLQYIFVQARETMLEDALQIANTYDSDMCTYAYYLYVQHLLEKGEYEKVLTFLDEENLPINVIVSCCEKIILRTRTLSNVPALTGIHNHYLSVLDSISSKFEKATVKLNENNTEKSTSALSADTYKNIKDVHYLKVAYGTELTLAHEFSNPGGQNRLLKSCLMNILNRVSSDIAMMEKECREIKQLSSCFELQNEEVYIEFIILAVEEANINVAVLLSEYLLKETEYNETISLKMINLAAFIFQHCISTPEYFSEVNIFSIIQQLMIVGLNHCPEDLLLMGIEIANWCRIMQSTNRVNTGFGNSNEIRRISYSNNITCSTVAKLLAAYSYLQDRSDMKPIMRLVRKPDSVSATVQNPNESQSLPDILQFISGQEQELTYFQIITTLHWSMLNCCFINCIPRSPPNSLVEQTKNMSGSCISRLLQKFVGSRHLDYQLSLSLMHYFTVDDATTWIVQSVKRFKHDFQRLYSITELGMAYFQLKECTHELNAIRKVRKQCVWGKRILEYGLSYKEAFRETKIDQKQLLQKLMTVPTITLNVLSKYCRDMDIDLQECLKEYLKYLLTSWEPQFEVKIDPLTDEKEVIVKPTHSKLLEQCQEVIALIETPKDILHLIWNNLNYYHYEIYMLLITLLEEKGLGAVSNQFATIRSIFLFLNNYRRTKEPEKFERDEWYRIHPNTQNLPPISKYRLPFTLIFPSSKSNHDPWKIINPELNIRTYSKWFPVLDALQLDKNFLCFIAINQFMSDETIFREPNTEWSTQTYNKRLLRDIQTCVENITNLEMVSASLFFVTNQLPPGADRLSAAKLCYLQANQWYEQEKSENALSCLKKAQKKYLTVATMHILFVFNLGKPQYLQLILEPFSLICSIYNDPIIVQKNTGNIIAFPDINKAAEEISVIHKVDILKIRKELLDEWLQPENFIGNNSFNETILAKPMDQNNVQKKLSDIDYENFQRACYVLERDINTFGAYLVSIIFDADDDSKPIGVRLRALQCLYAVTTEEKLEEITVQSTESIRDLLNTLAFVSELECVGLSFSISGFRSCNKKDVVLSLISLNSPDAISLATTICRDFNVKSAKLWNEILNFLVKYKMVKELSEVLPHLSNYYHNLDFSIFENAWVTLLLHPLQKASINPEPEEIEMIEKSVELVHFCPIIDAIDVTEIRSHCHRINRIDLADNIHVFQSK